MTYTLLVRQKYLADGVFYYNTEIRKIDSETSLNRITRYEMLITFDGLTNIIKNVVIRMISLAI